MKAIKIGLISVVTLFSMGMFQSAFAELAVIAHPDNKLVGISKEQLRDIYRGASKSFPDGGSVTAVDQDKGSAAREKFNNDVLKMSEAKRKSYWSKLVFTGKGKPPKSIASDEAVRDWVASQVNGLGYINGSKLNDKVKVLLILP